MTAIAPTSTGSATPSAWRMLDPMDRSWSGVGYVRAYLDIDMPAPERIRDALRSLALESAALGRWQTATPPRWRPVATAELEGWLDRAVIADDEPEPSSEHAFAVNAEPLDELPFRFVVGPSWISARLTHAVGDGYTVDHLVGHLLKRAAADEPMTAPWTVIAPRTRDRILVRDVLRHLPALFGAVRHRDQLAGGTYEPAAVRADGMADLSLAFTSGLGFPKTLRALRDEHYAGASAAAVGMVALRAAFARTLPAPRPGFECLFNTRSQEDGTTACFGNFSVGVYITPADDYSPHAVSREMAKVRDSGLPYIAAASLRARARTSSGDTVTVVAPVGSPRLTMSYMQQHTIADVVPGQRAGRSSVATLTRPNGIETITVQQVEMAGQLGVSVSFYPEVWARADIERALELFFADPAALLAEHRAGSASP